MTAFVNWGSLCPLNTFLDSSLGRDRGGIVMGIQTVARQLIGKGDIYMGRKAKKFTKIATNLNVRFGSLADISERIRHVRFTPRSGHAHRRHQCLRSATSGHSMPLPMITIRAQRSFAH
jgi:hypothetical protein